MLCGAEQGATVALHAYLAGGAKYGGLLLCHVKVPRLKDLVRLIKSGQEKATDPSEVDRTVPRVSKESSSTGQGRVSASLNEYTTGFSDVSNLPKSKLFLAWKGIYEFHGEKPVMVRSHKETTRLRALAYRNVRIARCKHKGGDNLDELVSRVFLPSGLDVDFYNHEEEKHMSWHWQSTTGGDWLVQYMQMFDPTNFMKDLI